MISPNGAAKLENKGWVYGDSGGDGYHHVERNRQPGKQKGLSWEARSPNEELSWWKNVSFMG